MIKKMICIAVCAWMCASCEKSDGGGYLNLLKSRKNRKSRLLRRQLKI